MKDAVLIKSFTNGITLLMREDASLEEILQELAVKFTEAKNFFGSSTMALSMEGREVSEVEEIRILDTIRENSNVRIACIVGHDEATNKNFIKALQHMEKKLSGGDEGQFYKGTLKNREVIETENSIVVLGCIPRKCCDVRRKYHYFRRTVRGSLCGRNRQGRLLYRSA